MAIALRRPRVRRAERRTGPAGRRGSILLEFLAALVSVVVVSAAGTAILEERLTTRALAREASGLTVNRLGAVMAQFEGRNRQLALTLDYQAELLRVSGALEPGRENDLETHLSRTANALGIEVLAVFDGSGRHLAGRGSFLTDSEAIANAAPGSRALVERTSPGGYMNVSATPIGDGRVLAGALEFSDSTAIELRNAVGDGQVVLVAGDRLAGSSLSIGPEGPPGRDPLGGALPGSPRAVTLGGEPMLVVYEEVASSKDAGRAALGVAIPDPVADLTESLALVRLLSTLVLTAVALTIGLLLFWSLVRPLVGLSRTATRIAQGDLTATFAAPRNNEIGRLAAALQTMTAELKGQTRRLQEASKRLLLAQQEERQRVARDLHDGMQQQLVVLAVKIKQLAASETPPNPLILEHLAAEAEEAAFNLQDLGRGIFPTVLGDQGVVAALRTSASRLPMKVRLNVAPELEDRRFGPEVEGTLYFVAMEGMANAQKHAPDSQLTIVLRTEPREVVLEVFDDGPGFEPGEEQGGAGLQNMADRVNAVGGQVNISSSPGAGARIVARIPLEPESG